jgi:glycosyltransferase involved in cell wall biosynthesis
MSTRKLRIAFATPEYVTENHFDGGLANYLNRVSRKLVQLGHDVHVVTLSANDESEFDHDGVMVHRVMLRRGWQIANRLTRYTFPTTLHWLNLSAQISRKLRQLHREAPFDLIQYPSYSSCGVFSIPRLRAAAHVVRASSFEPAWNEAAGVKRNLDTAATERLQLMQYRMTRNVYAPSRAMQTTLAQSVSLGDVRLIRSPFYVETRDWDRAVHEQFLTGKSYVLYFGRFQVPKGFHTLVQALPRFLDRHKDAYAVLVGRDMDTQLGSSMAAFARSECRQFVDRLILLENLPHAQLYPVIEGARLVALPSLIDNSPNSCLEAMGLGKVVIGTNGASFEELITDGVNGFLVPPNDPVALADKLMAAWEDPRLNEMSVAAKQRMQDFAPEQTMPSLVAYFAGVVNGRRNNGK